jgi:glutamate formiminotransferase/formiminotetrahydrofolate cyclodeaminase
VFEMIRHEAARHGAAVHHSELVGLIPQEALADVAVWYTQLDGFSPEQILESRLYAASGAPFGASSDSGAFLEALASPTPAPGGGSAAAYAGALGAALIQMVTGLTVGKAKYKNVEPAMLAMGVEAQRLRHELQRAVEDDAAAFEAVMGAYRLPKGTDLERSARDSAVQLAMLAAAEVPLRTASDAVQVMELSWRCAKDGNINAISDAASAGALARAALVAAAYNVRINLRDVEDRMPSEKMLKELAALEVRAGNLDDEIQAVMRERGGLA